MRSALAHAAQRRAERRQRSASISTVPPAETSDEYLPELAAAAASILYRSPLPSKDGRPVYILNAAAFPDAFEVDYDSLLSYVLARLPGEEELISGTEYEIIFFAGGQPEGATTEKKQGPGMGWYLQAYHLLSRATRKKLQRLYIVHPRTWVRVLVGVFGTIVSPKFRRKIIHVNTLSSLALQIAIEKLLIPPSVYLHDRKLTPDIYVPYATGRRAFGAKHPLPKNINTGETRLPRVLRETTSFLLLPSNIKMEGLFRIPPHSTLAGALKEAYDRGQQFIIWKEKDGTFVQPGIDQSLVEEVRLEDAYGVHLAASLIKQWYRELREPVFPESSYETLKERYSSPDAEVAPEDLVDLILPQSEKSPLSATSREILTRHLLPLLSKVAAHEAENKMNPENLSILFSMCLVCGSNQMEDAKVSVIVKKLLRAAIIMWPQLRDGMDISGDAFYADLAPPDDGKDYEDPLEEDRLRPQRLSEDDAVEGREGHRIILEDSEDTPERTRATTFPLGAENGTTLDRAALPLSPDDNSPQRAPTLPPRRPRATSGVSSGTASAESSSTTIPKRKPAPPILDPPRYSHLFDEDGNSLHVADSPTSYAPVDGFGPPRRGNWSFDEDMKKGFPPPVFPQPAETHPALGVPKRKAVSNDQRTVAAVETAGPQLPATTGDRSAPESGVLAKLAAQKAASASPAQQVAAAAASKANSGDGEVVAQSPGTILSEGDGVFRKTSWPASAHPTSLAKPMPPPRHAHTIPQITTNGASLSAPPGMPKPRAPSPGLLKRISSMEVSSETAAASTRETASLQPRRLNLRKTSVDDLRRLYEERVSTVQSLARADAVRKGSVST